MLPITGLIQEDLNTCLLDQNPDLKIVLFKYLQSIDKYVQALDIVKFMKKPAILKKYDLEKLISLLTAQQ